jgi:OmpA-OmpF porin, OOP family
MRTLKIAALLASLLSLNAFAQTTDIKVDASKEVGYAIDGRNLVVKSGYDLCWRTGFWTEAHKIVGCDGMQAAPAPVAKPVVAPAPAPAPVVAKPVAPVVAPVVVPVVAKKCDFTSAFGSDELFTFNKSTLTKAAQAKLDGEVVGKINGCAKVDVAVVTGHTDRLGSDAYNQKLSAKRAETVKAYLVSKGVKADIKAVGAGEAQPTDVKCDDKLGRKKLIACLAPNRRVVIDVKGAAK